uniref:Uncharacterized protein n=1 Tax=Anguilla anguilla TaxID=7936 RepID=A0A0E9XLV2_ANGAN
MMSGKETAVSSFLVYGSTAWNWGSPLGENSTQVKVMAPSRLLSLNRSRKVPEFMSLSSARSRSLLTKPIMCPSFQSASRCLLISSRIPSIHSQKGKVFSLLQNLVQGMSPSGFPPASRPSSLSPSMLSCSSLSPRLVTEENCQLSTSDSWHQRAWGALRKKDRFFGSVHSMLYHRIEAQPLGSWLTLEITTIGREVISRSMTSPGWQSCVSKLMECSSSVTINGPSFVLLPAAFCSFSCR